ncbi:MAG: pseudaminic acid synthase [Pseudomonadota bacterium]
MTEPIEISGRPIGPDHAPFVIAEISANHQGDLQRALELIDAAHASGADAIKIQSYKPDTITLDCDVEDFQIRGGPWAGQTLFQLYKQAQTPFEWHAPIFEHASNIVATLFSSPFDASAIDLLRSLNAPAYKIASFEAIDTPLIEYAAQSGKPLIISTGMADLPEISDAVNAARRGGAKHLALLHCISGYPTPADQSNLRTIPHLAETFDVVVGLSDHTLGDGVSVAAVALGARIIEKHFTLSRADGGPDAEFSLEPDEFGNLVANCRDAFAALGRVTYDKAEAESGNLQFRRSLYAVKDIPEGQCFTAANIRSIRPGHGMSPKTLPALLSGAKARVGIKRGTALQQHMIDWHEG